jgi:hypothetical protein
LPRIRNLPVALIGVVSAVAALLFAWAAAFTLGNHLFDWRPDKISAEWPSTLWVAAAQGLLAVGAAAVSAVTLKRSMRMAFWCLFAAAAVSAWIFLSIGIARQEPAYLWLIVGLPILLSYATARARHRWRTVDARPGTWVRHRG